MKSGAFRLYCLDALCILLFALGASYILLPLFGHSLNLAHQFLLLLGLLLFWSLLEIRLLLPFAVLAGIGLLSALIFWWQGESLAAFLQGFFAWCFSGMPENALYSHAWGRNLAYLLLLTPVVLLFWLLVRKLFSLWILCLLSLGLLLFQGFHKEQDLWIPFFLLCAALILCLPRGLLRTNGRIRAQFLALLFLPVILIGSFWLAPSEDEQWTSRGFQNLVHDIEDFFEYHWGDLPDWPITSMRSMGWMPQGDTLGGDVELDDQVVFSIDTNSPFLLRGEALDYYTGSSWQDTPDYSYGNFRLESLFWQGQRADAYGYDLPQDASSIRFLLNSTTITVDARIRCSAAYRSLFLPYRARDIRVNTQQQDLYFNTQGETYLSFQPAYSYSYQASANIWNHTDDRFDEHMLLLEEMVSDQTDSAYEEIASLCLQIPSTLPSWVEALCNEIVSDQDSPYAKAMALRDYLSEQCTYTLTPGTPDPEEDFVAYFLQDRQGYCVYYASALTVMCRLEGIPARYVTGYGMIPEENGNGYQATQATGHAWTEIYLHQIGWVPLDALSQDIFLLNMPIPEEPESIPSKTPSPIMEESEEEAPSSPMTPPEKEAPDSWNPLGLLWVLIPLAFFTVFLYYGMTYFTRKYTLEYVTKHTPHPEDAAEYYYHDLLRQLALFGLQIHNEDTMLSLGKQADRVLPTELGLSIASISQVMNRLRFGDYTPRQAEIEQMAHSHQIIEAHLRKVLGFWGYFLRRFLPSFFFSRPRRSKKGKEMS
ncbi:MAG: transglutaminase-like domain-containing protein [Lachnospirales bacterium]